MSRIGKQTIEIPAGVNILVEKDNFVVRGPKGELKRLFPPIVKIKIDGTHANVEVANPGIKKQKELWGTFAAHLKNMVEGVTKGFQKKLEINGVGYNVSLQGNNLKLEIGFSHPVIFNLPTVVTAKVEKIVITLDSADKELLGQVAAEIRNLRKPEPYKGKGIKYGEEIIRRKAGKTASKSAS
jgi:large subunit ribosomal protein L6